jgi:hypothetical protein
MTGSEFVREPWKDGHNFLHYNMMHEEGGLQVAVVA